MERSPCNLIREVGRALHFGKPLDGGQGGLLGSSLFQNRNHVVKTSLKAATAQQPPAPPRAPNALTEEQRLEAESSDEVIPVGDQLDLPLVPHLRERGTVGSSGARPRRPRKEKAPGLGREGGCAPGRRGEAPGASRRSELGSLGPERGEAGDLTLMPSSRVRGAKVGAGPGPGTRRWGPGSLLSSPLL